MHCNIEIGLEIEESLVGHLLLVERVVFLTLEILGKCCDF
jgi:hypothetical protein